MRKTDDGKPRLNRSGRDEYVRLRVKKKNRQRFFRVKKFAANSALEKTFARPPGALHKYIFP